MFSLILRILILVLTSYNIRFIFGAFYVSSNESNELIRVANAFSGCIIRVINFKGEEIDFQKVNEPIILLRYLSFCKIAGFLPFELRSTFKILSQNSSCRNIIRDKLDLTTNQVAKSYVAQTLKESFRMKNSKKYCEADVYLDPPTEHESPQMFIKNSNWESILLNPASLHFVQTFAAQSWKLEYLNSVPKISLLICGSTGDSICESEKDVKKWIAGVLLETLYFPRLSEDLLIWEHSSHSLKTLCPYCDPCDSFKTVRLSTKFIPNSRNELENILLECRQMNPDPHSVHVVLNDHKNNNDVLKRKERRSRKSLLERIQSYSFEHEAIGMHNFADIHLTSLLLPEHVNITFSRNFDKYRYQLNDVIVDACSQTKPIRSYFMFRPAIERHTSESRILFQESRLITSVKEFRFVSCHKEQMHWTSQLKELISPFDIPTWFLIFTIVFVVSWLAKLSLQLLRDVKSKSFHEIIFFMFWSILDQSINLFSSANRNRKISLFVCVYFIPIIWAFLSNLYKGENVTRLTAEPPLTKFDTFEMLEKNQITMYSRRINLITFSSKEYFNFSVLAKLHAQYGSVATHEAMPVVSELWFELMNVLRPHVSSYGLSLNYLKHKISKQMWKYLNNSAMLLDTKQNYNENLLTILDIYMSKCNKSAIILASPQAIIVHKILKHWNKPSFLGKDKIFENFWGYKFRGYFPNHLIFRARYIFEAGIFEWWQNYLEFSFSLKLDVHDKSLHFAKSRNDTSIISGNKTAIAVLTLIPGVGLLLSLIVFIFAENILNRAQRKKFKCVLSNFVIMTTKLYLSTGELVYTFWNNLHKPFLFLMC